MDRQATVFLSKQKPGGRGNAFSRRVTDQHSHVEKHEHTHTHTHIEKHEHTHTPLPAPRPQQRSSISLGHACVSPGPNKEEQRGHHPKWTTPSGWPSPQRFTPCLSKHNTAGWDLFPPPSPPPCVYALGVYMFVCVCVCVCACVCSTTQCSRSWVSAPLTCSVKTPAALVWPKHRLRLNSKAPFYIFRCYLHERGDYSFSTPLREKRGGGEGLFYPSIYLEEARL